MILPYSKSLLRLPASAPSAKNLHVARPLEEALTMALHEMILWLEEMTGLTRHEAYMLVGIAGHARPEAWNRARGRSRRGIANRLPLPSIAAP